MKLPCDVYVEPYFPSLKSAYTPAAAAQIQKPVVCQQTTVAVDRDSARDVSLFVGRTDGDNAIISCRIEDVTDIDSSKLHEGCLSLRTVSPCVQLQVYNTRALLLEDFFRLLKKLTERRTVGNAVRFRSNPEAVLAVQQKKDMRAGIVSRSRDADSSFPSMYGLHEPPFNGSAEPVHSRPHSGQEMFDDPVPRPYPAAAKPHGAEDTFRANLDSEIEGLRQAMAEDAKGRGQLEEAIQRLERENAYLNAQLKMELKSKVDLKHHAQDAKQRAEAAEVRLREKQVELQQRTEELIDARSGHETRIEEELRRLAEVEAYTNKAKKRLERTQERAAGLCGAQGRQRTVKAALRQWREVLGWAVGYRERKDEAMRRFFGAGTRRHFRVWKGRVALVLRLGGGLPQLALRQRRRMLDGTTRWWRGVASEAWRERVAEEVERLRAMVEEGKGRAERAEEEAKEARELLATAQGKARRGEEAREEEMEQARREVRQAEEEVESMRARLEEEQDKSGAAQREARGGRERERVALERLEEERARHEKEERALRERLRAAEETAERQRAELGMAKATQRELEDLMGRREGAVTERSRRVDELEGAVRTLEEERARLARQLQAEEGGREAAEGRRREVQSRLEELESRMEVAQDREEGRRAQVEAALQKLAEGAGDVLAAFLTHAGEQVGAFKEAKLRHRREVEQVARTSQLLSHFLSWRRSIEEEREAKREEEREALEELRREVELKQEEVEQLSEEVRDLEEAVREGRGREAELRQGRQEAEEQLASLKETYLRGVKASVHSIRMCRDKYLHTPGAAEGGGTH